VPSHMRIPRWFWALTLPLVVVVGLVIADPYLPTTVRFSTLEPGGLEEYKHIVSAHGFSFRTETNASGESYVVIEGISAHDYRPIDCAYWRWSTARARQGSVVLMDRPECAL
jgi:hypothetical protein